MNNKDKRLGSAIKYHAFCVLMVVLICTATTSISLFLKAAGVNRVNLLMIMLMGVLLITVITRGYTYGIITSVASIFSFNYYFTAPLHTFAISSKQDFLLLLFFTVAAIISGIMSSSAQQQKTKAQQNERTAHTMYDITESYLNLDGVDKIISHTLDYLNRVTGRPCTITFEDKYIKSAGIDREYSFPDNENPVSGADYEIRGLKSKIGTAAFGGGPVFSSETDQMIHTILYQMSIVMDRECMYLEREEIRLAMEKEHLKSTLLRSISHDIRTPLTEISGAGNVIIDNIDTLSKDEIRNLIKDINTEADWLCLTVQNILNMTRLSDGNIKLNMEYESVDDLLSESVSRLPSSYDRTRLTIKMPAQIMLVNVDGNLIVQVIINLVDNAYKHSGENSHITLSAGNVPGNAVIQVSDNGCGIAPAVIGKLFQNFITLPASSSDKNRGVGLGLSICHAIIEAHGGTIAASNIPSGGAEFTIMLPCDI